MVLDMMRSRSTFGTKSMQSKNRVKIQQQEPISETNLDINLEYEKIVLDTKQKLEALKFLTLSQPLKFLASSRRLHPILLSLRTKQSRKLPLLELTVRMTPMPPVSMLPNSKESCQERVRRDKAPHAWAKLKSLRTRNNAQILSTRSSQRTVVTRD